MKRISIIHSIVFSLCLFVSLASFAQLGRKIQLEEAVTLAVNNSHQLKYASAKIIESEAALKEARELKLPSAAVSGSHIRLNSPNIDLKIKPSANNGGTTSEPAGKISSATYGILNASLPLYAGSSIRYAIASASYLAEAARLEKNDDLQGVILNAIDAFNNLYKSSAAVDLVKENLGSAKERVRQFTSFEQNGILSRNDLLKAELQASNTEVSLLDAENNLKMANIQMDLLLGLPDTTVIIPDIGTLPASPLLPGMEEMIQTALQHRNDKASLEQQKKSADLNIRYAQSGKYPSLALTGGYIALYVPNLVTVTNAVNIGLGVQYNLASLWKNNSKVQQAKARGMQVAENEFMLTDRIKMEVQETYLGFQLTQKKMDTYRRAVAQAEENYKIVKNKYDNSLATTTDLLDADIAQLQTKLDFAFSQADASTAYSRLLKATGLLSITSNKQ